MPITMTPNDRTALNIVALSPNRWDGQWVNRQQLLSRIGRQRDVVYSNGAWSVWERGAPEWSRSPLFGRFERRDNVWLDEPPKAVMRWPKVKPWDAAALAVQSRRLRSVFAAPAPTVAYLCHPMFVPYVRHLQPDYVVYHCYDLYSHQAAWSDELEAAERWLLSASDLVFSPTQMLSDKLMEKAPCNARVLPNAADVQAIFEAARAGAPEPADLAAIPRPRFGYVGSVHPQLDLGLIAELARRHPEWQFVLVGPTLRAGDLAQMETYRACVALPNVHMLGERHRSEVPAYILNMDVNTMFYRVTADSWAHLAYPLKLHEYMACGHPVVSVDLKMIRHFEPLIAFAETADQWEAALAAAVVGDGPGFPERRREIAAQNGWESRVEVLDAWLDELPALRGARLQRAGRLAEVR